MMLLRCTYYGGSCRGLYFDSLFFFGVRVGSKRYYTKERQSEVVEAKTPKQPQEGTDGINEVSSTFASFASAPHDCDGAAGTAVGKGNAPTEPEPVRWLQKSYDEQLAEPIVDEKGQFIVSRVQWPTGEIAYVTPPPPDDRLAPRFGYNIVQVKKDVSWWKFYRKHPHISVSYINIQVLFLLGVAWLVAILTDEYRRTTDEMRTPGALVGEHRGRGPVGRQTQKIEFSRDEMSDLVGRAQNNWLDAKEEASYIGSKNYSMRKIPRPKEFSVEDFRKR